MDKLLLSYKQAWDDALVGKPNLMPEIAHELIVGKMPALLERIASLKDALVQMHIDWNRYTRTQVDKIDELTTAVDLEKARAAANGEEVSELLTGWSNLTWKLGQLVGDVEAGRLDPQKFVKKVKALVEEAE